MSRTLELSWHQYEPSASNILKILLHLNNFLENGKESVGILVQYLVHTNFKRRAKVIINNQSKQTQITLWTKQNGKGQQQVTLTKREKKFVNQFAIVPD